MRADLQQVVYDLALSGQLAEGDVERLAADMMREAARALGVERASVWLLEEDEQTLSCVNLFTLSTENDQCGMRLGRDQFLGEFEALATSRYMVTSEPLSDPRISGYVEDYIKPNGITAMLDAAIRTSGRVMGVICLEHVNRLHIWDADEIAFACQLADQLALALLNRERARALASLRQSEERLRLALEATRDGLWDWDIPTGHVYWDDRCYTMLGYEPGEFPMSREMWEQLLHPEERVQAVARVSEEMGRGEGRFRVEFRLRTKDGGWRWIVGRGKTVERDAEGQPSRMVGTHIDIDDVKRAELLRQEIERIVKHDLRKPAINAISAVRLIREGGLDAGDFAKALGAVESSGRQMIELIDTSLNLFRIETGRFEFTPEPLDCARTVSEVLEEMSFAFPRLDSQVEVRMHCPNHQDGKCATLGSRHLLKSALMNLIINAIEASPSDRQVEVSITRGCGCDIAIRNAGVIPREIRDRFFGKYVTFGKNGGTGLGAYSARRMIEAQGGSVDADVSDEHGTTTIRIHLPGAAGPRPAQRE